MTRAIRPVALAWLLAGISGPALFAQSNDTSQSATTLRLVPWRGLRAVANRAVVRYEPGLTLHQRTALHEQLGARALATLGSEMAVLELSEEDSLQLQLARLRQHDGIRYADPDVAIPTVAFMPTVSLPPLSPPPLSPSGPSDPKANLQWALDRVRAQEAWEHAQGNPEIVIAILDSGVDSAHPDLSAHVAWELDLYAGDDDATDTHGHGTHAAGLAAAATNNGVGIAGAGYACRYAAYRCGEGTTLPSSMILAGIYDSITRGAHVLSMSFGLYQDLPSLKDALQAAAEAGCVLVAAAGNDAQDVPFYPAAYPSVIGVAASAPNDSRALFSNFGPWVSLAAPGQSMYSTLLNGDYGYMSGTSTACPLVAGMAGLLYAQASGLRSPAAAQSVRAVLEGTAVPVLGNWVTAGRVDLAAAVAALDSGNPPVIDTLEPDAADALGGEVVSVSGSGLLGATGALLGSVPVAVTVLDDSTLTYTIPLAAQLGDLPFVVMKASSTSNALTFRYSAVEPPRLNVAANIAVGDTLEWNLGCTPGDFWIMLASLDQTTTSIQGWTVLTPFVVGVVGTTGDTGLGSFSVNIPASAAGITVHTQVISGPGYLTGATPIATTHVMP
ncbi:MAG: S8 family serine peptidase [Planctomycetota bacterium]|nr:S8 family serine peptidase [Planctomycetota bacterium]